MFTTILLSLVIGGVDRQAFSLIPVALVSKYDIKVSYFNYEQGFKIANNLGKGLVVVKDNVDAIKWQEYATKNNLVFCVLDQNNVNKFDNDINVYKWNNGLFMDKVANVNVKYSENIIDSFGVGSCSSCSRR